MPICVPCSAQGDLRCQEKPRDSQAPGSRPRGTEGEEGLSSLEVPQLASVPAGCSWESRTGRAAPGPPLCSLLREAPVPPRQRRLLQPELAIKAPLCVSGEAGWGRQGGHKAPAAVCLQTGALRGAEGLKALIVFN